ncbi:Variable outer membrane protein (plasmid) [Borrelia coriaceae ATCC 43381]|uniref:Variable large protein n=1 Tax=Borrelia coriaceae ATCC 43381 TaxID=1408429 RepID=W5SWQ9_9SPIR|nr:Variable outer membrane protein [Borrelia coriaceae ATCC 43381]
MTRNIKNRIKSICAILFISLFLSCNNGIEELEKRNHFLSSLANLGNDFLFVFTSFGDSFGGVLGFNAETPKSKVGEYFKKIKETVQGTKDKLNMIVENMKTQGNPNASSVEAAVTKLVSEKLDKIILGASEALKGAEGNEPIGNVATGGAGNKNTAGGTAGTGVESLVKGVRDIVDVVLGEKEGSADAGDDKSPVLGAGTATAQSRGTDGDARKLFANDKAGSDNTDAAKVAKDAYKATASVTGADILKAISKGKDGDSAKLAKKNDTGNAGMNAVSNGKDATIAGSIAL